MATSTSFTVDQYKALYDTLETLQLAQFDATQAQDHKKAAELAIKIETQQSKIQAAVVDDHSVLGLDKKFNKTGIMRAYGDRDRQFTTWERQYRNNIRCFTGDETVEAQRRLISLTTTHRYYAAMVEKVQTAFVNLKPR